ncbi:MFS transporter [Niveispirillum irakense]|uniref:MFS transporter n=1 Tax=Niveispirillum irakense TaxID=34011 RepID=UPI000401DD60|nr:MFS transporter [Niveispirillum irakense]
MQSRIIVCGLLVMGTLLGIAGIDLVLPALPAMATWPDGGTAKAQLIIAAYIGGVSLGLLLFGWLGTMVERRLLLIGSIAAYMLLSLACTWTQNMDVLIALRFAQGLIGCAPGVFAPGMIRRMFDEKGAIRAIGILGSIEAIGPGAAPLAGAALLAWGGWQAPFLASAALALITAISLTLGRNLLPPGSAPRGMGSYRLLLTDPVFLRYGLTQALVLGGLLVFIFGAPVVIVNSLGGTLGDFILMQMVGVGLFMICANLSGLLCGRFGVERMISFGTGLALLAALLLTAYALAGGANPKILILALAPMNIGLGLRGPPGFMRAVAAGRGDDDRASALVILAITLFAACTTAFLAPFLELGLPALALGALACQVLACLLLVLLPRLPDPIQ